MPASQQPSPGPGKPPTSIPERLLTPDEMLPPGEEWAPKSKTYLGEGGTDRPATNAKGTVDDEAEDPAPAGNTQEVAAKVQYLYGDDLGHGRVSWKAKPTHPDDPKSDLINKDSGYVVRKISQGVNHPWEMHSVIVRRPHIMKILRQILSDYPGVSPVVDHLKLDSPFKPMFHHWDDFCQAVEQSDDFTKQHVEGFVALLKEELAPYFEALENADSHNIIEHQNLWTIFAPHQLVWTDLKQHHSIGELMRTDLDPVTGAFFVVYNQTAWDGFTLTSESGVVRIPAFTGTSAITGLAAVPLLRKPDAGDITKVVLDRGRKFLGLLGCHYREYLGFGSSEWRADMLGRPQVEWEAVSGRVVLDAALWHGKVGDRGEPPDADSLPKTDQEVLICSPLIKGYSLTSKKWFKGRILADQTRNTDKLFVDNVSDIIWDDSSSGLVLNSTEKDLLLGFAQTKLSGTTEFDDLVRGKGKGVIILLSGPPGVGKTMTVESKVANMMRVPLYPVSAGELGSEATRVESQLRQALVYCKEWNAVLLLDESDVFLQERNVIDLRRNELVSIFLRLLEYYDGMMFLTTNRIKTMDPAFQSRIDLTVHYPDLSKSSRASVWRNFLQPGESTSTEIDFDELASHALNGRQIKNTVKLAKMLAIRREQALHMDHLRQILQLSASQSAQGMTSYYL
ncbi:unnamed protein product [Clonostachys solani]|uniref:AAA+ ATPase domain-containing protein n=1 Tax=Clonostachys solani TaxID=160281 RepID=A0A9N9ZA81_9HYPO|nr:unnamed protein product [Clonostachys solani]